MISTASERDIPDLKKIWSTCFGDDEAYMDLFFTKRFKALGTLVWREEDIPIAMTYLMPYTMSNAGINYMGYYIYAVAVLPEYRGRGISGQLLQAAEQMAYHRGAVVTSLVPGEPSLFDFYQKQGYHTQYYYQKATVCRDGLSGFKHQVKTYSCTPQKLLNLRDLHYGQDPFFVRWDKEALAYAIAESEICGRYCVMTECEEERQGYLIYEHHEDQIYIREIGCAKQDFISVVYHLFERHPNVQHITMRLKVDHAFDIQGEVVPFGMAKYLPPVRDKANLTMMDRLDKDKNSPQQPFMGLMLD